MPTGWIECQDPGATLRINGIEESGTSLVFLEEHTQGYQCCGPANDCSDMVIARQLVPEPTQASLMVAGLVALLGLRLRALRRHRGRKHAKRRTASRR